MNDPNAYSAPTRNDHARPALYLLAVAVLLVALMLATGGGRHLFSRENRYTIRFDGVGGLSAGSPVLLNGVRVGEVEEVALPDDPAQAQSVVRVVVARRVSQRIRRDSIARIRTLGLLGDKYVALTAGTPDFPPVADGGELAAAQQANVDEWIASGEDVMQNIASISHSFSSILARVDRGEGLLGELTVKSPEGARTRTQLLDALTAVKSLAQQVETGQGPVGRLLRDRELGDRFSSAVGRLDSLLATLQSGPGLVPSLLHDPATKQQFETTVERLSAAARDLSAVAAQARAGRGLIGKLLHDETYGDQMAAEIHSLVIKLNAVAGRLEKGDGTAAQLINDPQIYDAVKDILVGINESKMLRWLIRNRQKAGVRERYDREQKKLDPPTRKDGDAGPGASR